MRRIPLGDGNLLDVPERIQLRTSDGVARDVRDDEIVKLFAASRLVSGSTAPPMTTEQRLARAEQALAEERRTTLVLSEALKHSTAPTGEHPNPVVRAALQAINDGRHAATGTANTGADARWLSRIAEIKATHKVNDAEAGVILCREEPDLWDARRAELAGEEIPVIARRRSKHVIYATD